MILYLITLLIVVSIPVETVLDWLYDKSWGIQKKLATGIPAVYVSKAPFLFGLARLLNFAKGYIFLYLASVFFDGHAVRLVAIGAIVFLNNWSPLTGFENRQSFGHVLWGIYSFVFLPLFFIFPISVAVLSLVSNSLYIGMISSVLFAMVIIWMQPLPLGYLFVNFIVFLMVFLAYQRYIFGRQDGANWSLLTSFRNRR